MTEIKKEKLIEDIFKWVVRDVEVSLEKEKLLKIMVEATLDYLYEKGYLDIKEKKNGEARRETVEKLGKRDGGKSSIKN